MQQLCEPTFVDELEDSLLTNLLQDECELRLLDLQVPTQNSVLSDDLNVNLLDLRFTMGSHIDREKNISEQIQPFKLTPDGLVQANLSKIPMKYTSFPLTVQLLLEVRSSLALDIYDSENDLHLIRDDLPEAYVKQGFERHCVLFEGLLGSFDNQVSSLLRMKQHLSRVVSQLSKGEAFNVHEWKISDVDKHLYK